MKNKHPVPQESIAQLAFGITQGKLERQEGLESLREADEVSEI